MATIKDIAHLAGVSDTTVSNVIHNRSNVSAETAKRINRIMKEVNYVPNLNARSLNSKSSPLVACIYSSKNLATNNLYLSQLITSIEQLLFSNGLYLFIKTIDTIENITTILDMWNIKGLITIGNFYDSFFDSIESSNIPTVAIDAIIKKDFNNIYTVNIDDENAACMATEHLISLGHRKIAHVSYGISGSRINKARFNGYNQALKKHGITLNASHVFEVPSPAIADTNPIIEIGRKIAQSNITAVFANSDMIAWDVILGIQSASKTVPTDISVIGFDDIFICPRILPSLSSIHNSASSKGTTAAQVLVDILKNKKVKHRTTIPTHLVLRNSTSILK